MPRPSKCTPKVRETIAKYIALAVPRSVACTTAGIDVRTLRIWMERAEKGEQPYKDFAAELEHAEAEAHAKLVTRLYVSAGKDWRALAWILSRKYPDQWGDQIALKIEDGLQRVLNIVENVCSPEEFRRVLQALAAKDSGEALSDAAGDDSLH